MAKKLKEFPFSGQGNPKYPWAEWLNGEIWQLQRGVDFDVHVNSMRPMVSKAANKAGKIARTHTNGADGDTLVIQAVPR